MLDQGRSASATRIRKAIFQGTIMEIELKLRLAPADVPALRRHPLLKKLAIACEPAQQLTSIYFDSPALYLKQHGYVLRVRHTRQGWLQTLKHDGQASAGLYQRDEWESPVAGPHPDLTCLCVVAAVPKKLIRLLRAPELAAQLAPIFSTNIRRTIWLLETAQGDRVELALDQGKVECGTASHRVSEIELELKSGQPRALFALASSLQNKIALRVSNASKSALGFDLYAPQPPPLIKSAAISIAPTATVEQALQIIASSCLSQIQGNETGVLQGNDPEHIHQMRIGLRRLRLAIELFADAAPCDAKLRQGLDQLSAQLGNARNWDVLAWQTLPAIINQRPANGELDALQSATLAMATQQRQKAASAIRSSRYARLLLALGSWIQAVPPHAKPSADEHDLRQLPVKKMASQLLARYRKKMQRRGKVIVNGDTSTLHHLRIAAKKLRYTSEFFQSLQSSRDSDTAAPALHRLLETLGDLNDAACADGLLRNMVPPDVTHDASFVRGYLAARVERKSRKARRIWQQFVSASRSARK